MVVLVASVIVYIYQRKRVLMTQVEERQHADSARQDTILPPTDPDLIKPIEAFMADHQRGAALIADGVRTDVPDDVYQALTLIVQAMARGQAVTVAPIGMMLTTSQAADLLGVSRQTLVRLLGDNELPYERPRRHRLLRLSDVLAYKQRRHVEDRMALEEMTRQAVEDGLYNDSYEMYEDALTQARRGEI